MIRVLHELSALDGGGVAKLLFDYYSHMNHDLIHFDFLIYDFYEEGIYEKPLKDMGCTIYRLPQFSRERLNCLRQTKEIIKNGKYDVVHSHMGCRGFYVMYYAKQEGVKLRIAHSHIAYEPLSIKGKLVNFVFTAIAKHNANQLFACGRDAGAYMWGKKAVERGEIHIMRNAVDTSLFQYSEQKRKEKRKELGVENRKVIGIVGRLSAQKNYPFLFNSYKLLCEADDNVVLAVVGRGLEEDSIRNLAYSLGIDNRVIFLGVRNDVEELLNAFDIFVLPSLYEGLPVVLIEAQSNGLPEIVSDRITREMDITDLIEFLPIHESEELWAQKMLSALQLNINREDYSDLVKNQGYDIRIASQELYEFYAKHI